MTEHEIIPHVKSTGISILKIRVNANKRCDRFVVDVKLVGEKDTQQMPCIEGKWHNILLAGAVLSLMPCGDTKK